MAVQQEQRRDSRPLTINEALEIAARHGIIVRAEPLVVMSYTTRTGARVTHLYLPHYIVHVEVARGAERAWVEPAFDGSCDCDCGGGY